MKPIEIVEKDTTGRFLQLFTSMGEVDGDVDLDVASEFVCLMYGQTKTRSVDEACYSKLMQMTGKIDQVCFLCNWQNRNYQRSHSWHAFTKHQCPNQESEWSELLRLNRCTSINFAFCLILSKDADNYVLSYLS